MNNPHKMIWDGGGTTPCNCERATDHSPAEALISWEGTTPGGETIRVIDTDEEENS